MDQALPPLEDILDNAGKAVREFLVSVMLMITGIPGEVLDPDRFRKALRRFVIPAEMVLRRMIWALAARMTPEPAGPAAPRRVRPDGPTPAGHPSPRRRVPLFRLTEPAPRLAAPPPTRMPETGHSALAVPDPEKTHALLNARIAALNAALADPEAAARRLLRKRAAKPLSPLRMKAPPFIRTHRFDRIRNIWANIARAAAAPPDSS